MSALVGVAGHALAVTITEFPTSTANNNPQYITTGPDGALWFTEFGDGLTGVGSKIVRLTTSGTMTEFALPTWQQNPAGVTGITQGPDGK